MAAIRSFLQALDQTPEGRTVLQEFERTAKFDDVPPGSLVFLAQAMPFVEEELGLR